MKLYLAYLPWLAAAAILVVIFGALYGVVQQAERTGANFPQIQLSEDIAADLNAGAQPTSFTAGRTDVAASLAPFVIIYDRSGRVVSGSGYLDGQIPVAPLGMLENARGQDYHAITWQPANDVRIASVTVAANKYYVLSGRNLREVEKEESWTLWRALAAGAAAWFILGCTFVLTRWTKASATK